MLKNTICIFVMLLFLALPKSVSAQVVINEILPNPVGDDTNNEWVELYNQSVVQADLTGYKLKDASDHEQLISGVIAPNGYLVVIAQGSLSINNDNETISLFDSTLNTLDSYNYSNSIEGKSWGRYPDGGTFSSLSLNPTSGSSNQAPSTPTPVATATPTNEPTISPTKSSTPTASPTLKSSPTKSPSPKPTASPTSESEETDEPESGLVLGDVTVSTSSPETKVKGVSTTNKKPVIAFIFIFTGVLFLGYGGYLLYNMNSKNNDKRNNPVESKDTQSS